LKRVVSFSGGRTSAYLCTLMKEKYGDDVDFVFMDTGAEHPNTYDFIRKVDKAFKLDLICLKARFTTPLGTGNPYEIVDIDDIGYNLDGWKEMLEKYSTPYNPSGAFCTMMLKNQPFYKFCDNTYGKKEYITWLGIRADEPGRLKERERVEYLANISDFEKSDILKWWEGQPFNLDLDSAILGNCVFCIKRRPNKTAMAIKLEPKMAQDFIDLVEGVTVRIVEGRKAKYDAMYRGKQSLENIRKLYSEWTYQEIEQTVRGRKDKESECSESCELTEEIET
jgi:hypothetical protein